MPKFTQGSWIFHDEYILTANKSRIIADVMATLNKDEFNANGRLIASAPEMYELLKEELIPSSDYGGVLSFERERKVRELLARIDGNSLEEEKHE